MTGLLLLASTPIGNPGDATTRLRESLGRADVIAAEDTRRLRRLLSALEVQSPARVVSFHDHNEGPRTAALVDVMLAGETVLLVTDAGTPSVSDPGYRLLTAAVAAGVSVSVLPGPSALLAALTVSGLPVDRFVFEGFLPRTAGSRRTRLDSLATERRTLVFFEAPHRLGAVLRDMAQAFGVDRAAAVCRELTKTHEEVRRDRLDNLADWASGGVRGEITVVVGGAEAAGDQIWSAADLVALVASREQQGETRKAAIAAVAKATGVQKRLVFDAVVAQKSGAAHA